MINKYTNPIAKNSSLYEFFNEPQNDLDINDEIDSNHSDSNNAELDTFFNYNQEENEEENEEEEEEEEDLPIGCCGLTNLGNTCYMNSCIQALSNTKIFCDYIINRSITNHKFIIENYFKYNSNSTEEQFNNYISNKCLSKAFQITLETMWSNNYNTITPTSIRNCTKNNFSEFNNFEQQDAEEYLLAVINKLDDELKYSKINIQINNEKFKNMYDKFCLLDTKQKKLFIDSLDFKEKNDFKGLLQFINYNKNYSKIQEIFQFMTSSTITCSCCNHKTISFEPNIILEIEIPSVSNNNNQNDCLINDDNIYNGLIDSSENEDENTDMLEDITLNLSEEKEDEETDEYKDIDEVIDKCNQEDNNDEININTCLDNFFKLETLSNENKYICEKCNKPVEATKKILLNKIGDVIIIQFKRFKQVGNTIIKNKKEVNFPYELNLKKYTEDKKDSIYELKSIINHEGDNTKFGHYTTYAKNNDNDKWYYFNDELVTEETNLDLLFDEDAYILIYEKK